MSLIEDQLAIGVLLTVSGTFQNGLRIDLLNTDCSYFRPDCMLCRCFFSSNRIPIHSRYHPAVYSSSILSPASLPTNLTPASFSRHWDTDSRLFSFHGIARRTFYNSSLRVGKRVWKNESWPLKQLTEAILSLILRAKMACPGARSHGRRYGISCCSLGSQFAKVHESRPSWHFNEQRLMWVLDVSIILYDDLTRSQPLTPAWLNSSQAGQFWKHRLVPLPGWKISRQRRRSRLWKEKTRYHLKTGRRAASLKYRTWPQHTSMSLESRLSISPNKLQFFLFCPPQYQLDDKSWSENCHLWSYWKVSNFTTSFLNLCSCHHLLLVGRVPCFQWFFEFWRSPLAQLE